MGSSKRAAKCCSFSAPGLPDGSQLLKTLPNSTSNASQNEPKIVPKSPWGHLLEPGGCLVRVLGYPPPPKVRKITKNRQTHSANNHKNATYKKVLCLQILQKNCRKFCDSCALRASHKESYNIRCGSPQKVRLQF